MDRKSLRTINIISIPVVVILIIVSSLGLLHGLLSLIGLIIFYYFLILFYVNVRESVLDYINYKTDYNNLPIDPQIERQRKTVKYLIFIGVLAIGAICCIQLWFNNAILLIVGLEFILMSLLLAFFINISYTVEFISAHKIRINYTNIIVAIIIFAVLAAFVFIYMTSQIIWYIIFFTLVFLILAAYSRTMKTIGFLKYIQKKPVNDAIERDLKIFNFIALVVGICVFLYLPGLITMIIQLAIVTNLTKIIHDISLE